MRTLRFGIIALWLLGCWVPPASAEVNFGIGIGIGTPNLSIGINLSTYPELAPVPGYPVYYAPRLNTNYFFYDGMYWVYLDDYWYASNWYNGPWWVVQPEIVPVYILRIPVRYYRQPPVYFRGWRHDAPPRWGHVWGKEWEHRHKGWNKWDRSSVPPRAPLPAYQRQYAGDRYPRQVEQQQELRDRHYRYQPRDKKVRQHFAPQGGQRPPAPPARERQEDQWQRAPGQQDRQRPPQYEPGGQRQQPTSQPPGQQRGPAVPEQREPRGQTYQEQRQPRGPGYQEQRQQPGAGQYEQQRPSGQEQRYQDRDRDRSAEPGRGHGREQRGDDDRGR